MFLKIFFKTEKAPNCLRQTKTVTEKPRIKIKKVPKSI
jgi:hypothetical protein